MITEILLSLCALMFFYLAYIYGFERPKGFPPGPPRLPIFGSYLFMMMVNYRYLHKSVLKFTKWYKSDIVGFYVGSFPVVAVHSAETVREVLNNTDLDGRALVYVAEIRHPENKILEHNTTCYKATRLQLTIILRSRVRKHTIWYLAPQCEQNWKRLKNQLNCPD